MTNPIYYQNQPLLPVTNNPNQQVGKPSKTNNAINQQVSFNQVLQQEMQQVKFSQHAIQRLQILRGGVRIGNKVIGALSR